MADSLRGSLQAAGIPKLYPAVSQYDREQTGKGMDLAEAFLEFVKYSLYSSGDAPVKQMSVKEH